MLFCRIAIWSFVLYVFMHVWSWIWEGFSFWGRRFKLFLFLLWPSCACIGSFSLACLQVLLPLHIRRLCLLLFIYLCTQSFLNAFHTTYFLHWRHAVHHALSLYNLMTNYIHLYILHTLSAATPLLPLLLTYGLEPVFSLLLLLCFFKLADAKGSSISFTTEV